MRFSKTATYAGLFIFVATGSAFAHAEFQSSVPQGDATVKPAPSEVSITFSEEVNPSLSQIVVDDATGKQVDKADSHIVGSDAKQLAVGLQPLAAGTYEVLWTSVAADDGHKLTGKFKFTVAP